MTRKRIVSLALVGLFVWGTACTSYKQIEVGEVAYHGTVRVTVSDGERKTLDRPWVEADSLKGYQHIETLAIPLDQVAALEASSISAGRTALVAVGGLLVLLVVLNAIDCANNPEKYGC